MKRFFIILALVAYVGFMSSCATSTENTTEEHDHEHVDGEDHDHDDHDGHDHDQEEFEVADSTKAE